MTGRYGPCRRSDGSFYGRQYLVAEAASSQHVSRARPSVRGSSIWLSRNSADGSSLTELVLIVSFRMWLMSTLLAGVGVRFVTNVAKDLAADRAEIQSSEYEATRFSGRDGRGSLSVCDA